MTERQALHAYLSEQAHKAWQDFAEHNGVSVTGLLEAIGQELIVEIKEAGGEADEIDNRRALVKAGRKIDAERRRRGAA